MNKGYYVISSFKPYGIILKEPFINRTFYKSIYYAKKYAERMRGDNMLILKVTDKEGNVIINYVEEVK